MTEQRDPQGDTEPHEEEHHAHLPIPDGLEKVSEEIASDKVLDGAMIANAIGGWRGLIDSGLPSLVFVIFYLVNGNNLSQAIWAAIIAAVIVGIFRLARKQSLQQVLGGFVGIGISALIANTTDSAVNFFLPGLLLNAVWGLAGVISIFVKWPLVGVALGAATGDLGEWRENDELKRAYTQSTWYWVIFFWGKLVIQLPLYFMGLVGALGIAKIALHYPFMVLCAWLTYIKVREPMRRAKAAKAAESD
ncbi:MAG: DUF3159 domain-containing protein [Candidatus Nanopelagicales bacterium]